MKYFVLTNNPIVKEQVAPAADVVFQACGIRQIFEQAAIYVSKGHRLLSHPLSGSVKPGETPYKSMMLACDARAQADAASMQLVSQALLACDKFADKSSGYSCEALRDLQVVDAALIAGALESANGW